MVLKSKMGDFELEYLDEHYKDIENFIVKRSLQLGTSVNGYYKLINDGSIEESLVIYNNSLNGGSIIAFLDSEFLDNNSEDCYEPYVKVQYLVGEVIEDSSEIDISVSNDRIESDIENIYKAI